MFGSGGTFGSTSGGLGGKPAGSGFTFGGNSSVGSNQQGLFGSSNTGLFGNQAGGTGTGSGSTGSGGLFGSNNSGGGLFGGSGTNTNANNATTTNTNTNNNSGGLFGSNTNTNNASSGLFGSNSTNTGSGLFGSNSNQNTLSGLFGSGNTPSNTGNNSSGGLFGKPSGGLFGSNTQSNTGLFGQQGQSNLFGQGSSNSGQGSLFGSGTGGQSNTGNTGQGSTGLGSTGLGSTGQGSTGQGNTQGLFGSGAQGGQGQSTLFGSNQGGANSSQPSFSWSGQQAQAKPITNIPVNSNVSEPQNNTYTPAINDQLLKVKEQIDPGSSKLALKTHFYNKLNDQEVKALINLPRPANETSEDWDEAMNKRPSPSYYPVKVVSFSEVAKRIELQLEHVAKSRVILNSINDTQSSLSSKHDLDNTTRIIRARAKHTKLSRRLLRLATVLAIVKMKGYPLLPEEEEISKQFELLNSKVSDPNSSIGKLNDIFARLSTLKEKTEDLNYQFDNTVNSMNGLNSKEVNEGEKPDEIIKRLSNLLLKQQIGLNYVNDILEKDLEAVEKR